MKYDISKTTAPKMPNLGRGLECVALLLSQVSKDMHQPIVPMLFPILGTHVSGAEFMYLDLSWKEPSRMLANLVADNGTGKGQLSSIVEALYRDFRTQDDEELVMITPIDVIKGISGKYGNNSNDYFAINSSSNKIHLAKFSNPYKEPATEKQLAQREKFATKQAASTAWLNTNRTSEKNGLKGSADYQRVQKLKRAFAFSNINQVIYKYMDDKGNIKLPESTIPTTKPGNGVGGGGEIET